MNNDSVIFTQIKFSERTKRSESDFILQTKTISYIQVLYFPKYMYTYPFLSIGPTAHASRMAGYFRYVSNTTSKEDDHLCFHEIQTNIPLEDQIINCSIYGRYIIYYNERNRNVTYLSFFSAYAYNDLCEVEVFDKW